MPQAAQELGGLPRGVGSVTYESIDGVLKTKRFTDVRQARKFAQHYLGETPELGSWYAVSGDGIGKITCSGYTLADLFPRSAS
jgi:hypothetical protein